MSSGEVAFDMQTADMSTNVAPVELSIVIPCYLSEKTLPLLCARIFDVADENRWNVEIVCVDDGSPDDGATWKSIVALAANDPRIVGLRMMRNFGQHNALLCGVRFASGPIIVTLDDDLQHDPADIPALLQKLEEGYDVVYGTPLRGPHGLWRNVLSRVSKSMLSRLMGFRTIRDISAFRVMRASLRHAFDAYRAPDVLFDVLLSWGTTRFATLSVTHAPRTEGRSNYNLSRLIRQALLILTGYSTAPLRIASILGFAAALFGIIVLIYVAGTFLFLRTVAGFTFLASVVAIFSGVQLFALGTIGEYLSRMFNRTMDRPTYVVSERITRGTTATRDGHA